MIQVCFIFIFLKYDLGYKSDWEKKTNICTTRKK